MMLYTIDDIKQAAAKVGSFWFSKETLDWWGTTVFIYTHPDDKGGAYFITSDDNPQGTYALFSVRHCTKDGQISTPHFQEHATYREAVDAIEYITSFQWKRDVPIWAVLKFAEARKLIPGLYMVDWKETPKGGKLTTYDPTHGVVTGQMYR